MIDKLNSHYSFTNPASIHDEEALTALELAGRTAAKMNEVVEDQNNHREEMSTVVERQDAHISVRLKRQDEQLTLAIANIPNQIDTNVEKKIEDGTFDSQISHYMGDLETRVDNLLGSVTEGTTTLDAEVIDMRVDFNGNTYTTAGESVRTQNENIDKRTSFIESYIKTEGNLLDKVVSNKYPANENGKIVLKDSESITTLYVRVPDSKTIACATYLSNVFTWVIDKSGNIIADYETLDESSVAKGVYKIPDEGVQLVFARGTSGNFATSEYWVFIDSESQIIEKGVTTSQYPVNVATKVFIDNLYSREHGAYMDDLLIDIVNYDNLKNKKNTSSLINGNVDFNAWNTLSSVSHNPDGSVDLNVGGELAGVKSSSSFTSNSECLRIVATGTASDEVTEMRITLIYQTSDGTMNYSTNADFNVSGDFNISHVFDCANLAVYSDAVLFWSLVQVKNESGEVHFTTLQTYERGKIETLDVYAEDFTTLIENINNKIDDINVNGSVGNVLVSPSGKRFSYNVSNDGVISTIPHIPNKTLFIGNSLLLGMAGFYGMCASSPRNDYAYHVQQAILERNMGATFTKLHSSQFEMAASVSAFDTWWNANASMFESDLDLIICQIGDNVNTDELMGVFTQTLPLFIERVRTASPNARIIWVDGWYNSARSHATIFENCNRWNIPNVFIKDLNVTENQGYSGQTYELADGSTATVLDTWISHPGDTGFKLIADRIISALDM